MKPQRETKATLSDVLERMLDKGVIINADVVISLADVPLIGLNLRAALAGMETMIQYGLMREYDAAARMEKKPSPHLVALSPKG